MTSLPKVSENFLMHVACNKYKETHIQKHRLCKELEKLGGAKRVSETRDIIVFEVYNSPETEHLE